MAVFFVAVGLAGLFALLTVVCAALWVYRDAKGRGAPAGTWTVIVVLSGVGLGLMLYLLIGKKQGSVCSKCGTVASGQGAFCPACGERAFAEKAGAQKGTALAALGLVCFVLMVASVGISLYLFFTAGIFPALGR